MLMQLIRKDILLAKKYMIVMIAFIVFAQVLPMIFSAESAVQSGSFLVGLVFGQLIFFTTLSQLETRYPKATALLNAAPYTRSEFVKARYLLLLLLFVFSFVVNIIVTLILGSIPFVSPTFILVALLVDMIIFGIYIPLEYRYGYTKVRFIYIAVILVVAFLPQLLVRFSYTIEGSAQALDVSFFGEIYSVYQSIPLPVWCVILVAASAAVFYLSIRKSIKIFNKREL